MADKNKKKKFSLKKLIYNDKYLIVFSIIAAVIVLVSAILLRTNLALSATATVKLMLMLLLSVKNILQGILQPMTLRFSFKLIQSLQKVIMMFLLM